MTREERDEKVFELLREPLSVPEPVHVVRPSGAKMTEQIRAEESTEG